MELASVPGGRSRPRHGHACHALRDDKRHSHCQLDYLLGSTIRSTTSPSHTVLHEAHHERRGKVMNNRKAHCQEQ
ncbi:hypothetical protein AvCA_35410 [Azotobacter vinelandii CA]|uniref:Uncharacterized protein n=2 Tax=Azotobacter vinelandii TaxID=354 RepID=C1DR32_AZOVD|nr:hypothetical protein Avin_35410 [Azotobacter vinelandii DJ]AGK14605.1 hypothetical protein AvCA_35410 [Azotobacter vinelandii CA]AGK21418.1 hypothetical protein AvCA6_35410 [Azotobacter vinelandii CA6]